MELAVRDLYRAKWTDEIHREALAFSLEQDLKAPENFVQLKHFEILSWLIANEYLDIKIAVPTKDKGIPIESDRLLDPQHIFHEKVGIFTDSKGDRIAFSGSNNESLGGWERNVESFHVYCDWEGDRDLERVNEEAYRFEQLSKGTPLRARPKSQPPSVMFEAS